MKTFCIYKSYNELPKDWDNLAVHDIFLQTDYLKALEEALPNNINLYYIGVFKEHELVGIAVVQRVQLYLKDMFRQIEVSCAKEFFRSTISRIVKGNVLVVGNLTHTGQHGIFFNTEKISVSTYLDAVFLALTEIEQDIKLQYRKKIRAIMFKDFFENDSIHLEKEFFKKHRFSCVSVQPNMIMDVRKNWASVNDYVNSFNKKYKDRYKRARRKLNGIKPVEMQKEDLKNHSRTLHDLYLNVSNNAKFNTFILPENHFYNLKVNLKDSFRVFGYFLNNELIGFYTLILNGKNLETYFLGYDAEHQYPNQLYLNMLYDMAKYGIENNFKTIVYARTAMEIKSSVGALPKAMVMYVKHTNGVLNTVLKQLFKFMAPTQKWVERHPFK
ncbi:GNAT family N-acetyltransferase [Flavobacteriaceae bacterium XHP0103]|uniref:GNAT family N-acetyltransferase n=1 Tax=Marixanthotalea marina TaxID=2844359 RepID=UPI002989EEE7|nr:GNAT family N-acetyltransferase [Marixanthotalea marina]MBU3820617.1 GNAT family N-acetyltransferase [Marixanthotalea marina]